MDTNNDCAPYDEQNIKMAHTAAHLNAVLFWGCRCRVRYYSSPPTPPPFHQCLCGDNSMLKKPNSNNYRNMKAKPTWQQETSSFLKWPLVSSVMSFSRSRWKSATPIDNSTESCKIHATLNKNRIKNNHQILAMKCLKTEIIIIHYLWHPIS